MKHLLSALALSVLLLSCSKSSDDGPPAAKTTVNFTNKLSQSMSNTLIGSWNGAAPAKLIKNVGTLAVNASTGEVELTDKTLIKVYLYADFAGETYMTPYGFGIGRGTFNNWAVDGNVIWNKISKTSDLYPR